MQQTILEPVVVKASEDRAPFPLSLGGQHITSKVRGADTGGAFSVLHLVAESTAVRSILKIRKPSSPTLPV